MLPNTNITTTNVGAEIGSSSHVVSTLVGMTGLNLYSYYAPGQLSVDGSKNIVLTPPSSNFKLGDFRSYNNIAFPPVIWQFMPTIGWRTDYANFVLLFTINQLNLYAFADRGDYLTIDIYHTSATRTSGTYRMYRSSPPFAITVADDTPLVGHSRQSAKKPSSGYIQCPITSFQTSWLASPDDNIYCDFYISDVSNNRKINLGTSISAGYATFATHYMTAPFIFGQNTNIPAPPYGYTAIFPAVYATATNVCNFGTQLAQTFNTTTFDFFVVAKGIFGSGSRVVELTSTDIILTVAGVRTKINATPVSIGYTSGYHCTGTLSAGASWNYDSVGSVTFEYATVGTNYTQC
jgi:hypothetical protein